MHLPRVFAAAILCCAAAAAQAQHDLHAFVYGNSLVNHPTDSPETAVPYWLGQLARAGGHELALSGTWGFLQDFARDLPPTSGWSFPGVEQSWDTDRYAFRRAEIDTVILTPQNFIQAVPADHPYQWDNPRDATPLGDTLRVIDWTSAQARGARFWVYEGWADMAQIVDYPPDAAGLVGYHAANLGAYHDWYVDYVAQIAEARPNLDIALIPVASVLARLLTETSLADLPTEALYSDDAPHGTGNLYFLASLVTYSALFAEAPPATVELPDTLHPLIRDAYPQVAAAVWAASTGAVLPEIGGGGDPVSAALAPGLVPDTGLADPSLAMGLNGIADWSTQAPFLDLMKTARPWTGHLAGQHGGYDMARLVEGGYLSPEGWPLALPEDVVALEAFILTDQPSAATSLAGRYVVTWQGQGDLSVIGIARDVAREGAQRISFGYRPGDGLVALRIEAIDAADPIRNIRVVREDRLALAEAGVVFNPDWIARVRDLRSVRFMDWMFTNGSPQISWADRPLPGDFSYGWRGVPLEVMLDLANTIGADPWFTLPHMADDDYVVRFASMVHARLDPRLRVYAEWSNEVWNFLFPQAAWAQAQADARWGEGVGEGAWMQFAGMRAAQVADIWAAEYGADADRLVRVIGVHTGWIGLEEVLLDAPLSVAEGAARPGDSFDGYAVTGYFGHELGEDTRADEILGWIDDGTAAARATAELRAGSFAELTEVLWPYHAGVATREGMHLLMYEGGTHIVGYGAQSGEDRLTDFYTTYNYSPDMALLYADLLTSWRGVGGGAFNAFVDVAGPSRYGSWGALRHLDDANPRWSTLMAFNAVPSGEARAEGAFLHGITVKGTDVADDMQGTPEEDIFLADAGDDLIGAGPGDIVHGGPGVDTVLLLAAAEAWPQQWQGQTLVLTPPLGMDIRLTAVEFLGFSDAPLTGNAAPLYPLEPPE